MLFFGILCLILGVAILFNPALLGFLVGFFLFVLGSWVILGWYKVNKVLEKTYSVGKYNIIFQKKGGSKK
ncbi:hypothetical protein KA057_01460 [Candidatus Gracilibacteria bacterium]|nr:hypothetical protein [Candidatus Gracilibacteria bacterium]